MVEYTLRLATKQDVETLWHMLYYAAHMHDEIGKVVADAKADPALALYVDGWGRAGDIGIIAEKKGINQPLGAAWCRLFTGEAKAYSGTNEHTPELAIAVLPTYAGQGIGTALLNELLHEAKAQCTAIALNVRAENPAVRLYQRLGFVTTGELTNRAGGLSYNMLYRYQ